ncbi:hypothetical protein MCAG_04224 [Micromonospora sp. ATCC 39149]|nr:hypothetical protein [Micromonospora sp. ATCC 39149]EEP73897.1 hypothetical protein MCAG_04224 [Micromonospora sp. ATCC 39149]
MSTPREHPTDQATGPIGDRQPTDDRPAPGDAATRRNGSRRRGADGRFRPRDTPGAALDEPAAAGPVPVADDPPAAPLGRAGASAGLEEVFDAAHAAADARGGVARRQP